MNVLRRIIPGGRTPGRVFGAAALGALLLAVSGCLGTPPPREIYLRVDATAACPESARSGEAKLVVAVKPLSIPENLDRPAVMEADGPTLVPSLRWYWEADPREMVASALVSAVNCRTGAAAVMPYAPRLEHDAVLSGRVEAFNSQREGAGAFVVRFELSLWTKNGGALIASRSFEASSQLAGSGPKDLAEAASKALSEAAAEGAAWTIEAAPGAQRSASGKKQ